MAKQRLVCTLALVDLVVFCSAADAAAILTQDNRGLEVLAEVSEAGIQTIGPMTDSPAFGAPFESELDTGLLTSTPTGASEARAVAAQTSGFDVVPTFTSVSATASATSAVHFGGDADAISDLVIQFSVTTPQDWSIAASILSEGSIFGGDSSAFVRLREADAAEFIFSLDGVGDFVDSANGTLLPGDYELAASATTTARPARGSSPMRHARFEFEFTIIPEPTTGLLLLGCIAFVTRRSSRIVDVDVRIVEFVRPSGR